MPRTKAQRDPDMEREAMEFIEAVSGEKLNPNLEYPDNIKDGVILCNMMNKLMPGCIKKIDKKGGGFALMQNIERFNKAAGQWGVPVRELFQTVDLWEKKNVPAVTLCIHAIGRACQMKPDYNGPVIGAKMSETQTYDFTPEQLAAAKNAVPMQAGYNQGANQAGINMGKARSITD